MIPKFRAWDTIEEEMCEVLSIDLVSKYFVYETETDDYEAGFNNKNVTLMQSTGLTDKNGNEIFEGDVVECYTEGLSVVEFVEGVFGLRCNGYFEGFNLVNGQCVIIGNIHEHPELIEKENDK